MKGQETYEQLTYWLKKLGFRKANIVSDEGLWGSQKPLIIMSEPHKKFFANIG
jgi:hypothetical protein